MRVVSWIVVCTMLLPAFSLAAPEPAPAQFDFVAVKGTKEGNSSQKVFDKKLESVRKNIEKLNYSTFERIAYGGVKIPFGKPSTFMIDETYTLIVEPTAIDKEGRIRLKIQVMMKKETKEGVKMVKALETIPLIAKDKRINIGGLKLKGGGDLILVLSVE